MVHSESAPFVFNSVDAQEKYVIANRDFNCGDEILAEDVLLVGPIAEPRSPLCLGCGVDVDSSIKCYDCGWPICDFDCDKLSHHKSNECELFKKCSGMSFQRLTSKKGIFHQYCCILPLRLLLLSEKSPEQWKCIEKMNSFVDIRRENAIWQKERTYVVKYIRQKCKLKRFDEDLIHQVCGIIDVNCFPMNSKNNLRCLYAKSQYFSHSCIPNTTCVILPSHDFRIFIRASVNIPKGAKLTYSRVKVIMPTLLRRQELVHTSCVSCCCARCSDPTELNSNFSSLNCPKCKEGYIQSLNPLDFESDWECIKCAFKKRYSQLKKLYNEVEKELNRIQDGIRDTEDCFEKCEELLMKYEPVFHFNHSFIVFLKYYSLMSLNAGTFQISDHDSINKKIIRLYEILTVFNIISPGYNVLRGTTFHWLYKAYIAKAQLFNTNDPAEHGMYTKYMSKALRFLEITEEIMIIGKPFSQTDMEL